VFFLNTVYVSKVDVKSHCSYCMVIRIVMSEDNCQQWCSYLH